MIRPRILPHLAVIAALVTAFLPLMTLLRSGWFGPSVAIIIAIIGAGYAGRWVRGSIGFAAQLLVWFAAVWWAYPGGFDDLIGIDSWGVPRVVEEAGMQLITSIAPVDAAAPLRFVLVAGIGLLAILIDALANTWRMPLVAVLPLVAVFIAPQIAVPQGDHLMHAIVFGIALLLMVALRGSTEPRRRSWIAGGAIAIVATSVALVATPMLPFAPTTGVAFYSRPTSVDVSIELGDDLRNRSNVEVFQVRTTLASAPYLRLATHTRFGENGWSVDTGASQPLGNGFDRVRARNDLDKIGRTTWIDQVRLDAQYLPLPENAVEVTGAGDGWQGIASNRTARTSSGTTQGAEYSVDSVEIRPTSEQFDSLQAGDTEPSALEVPAEITDGIIGVTAREVTAGKTSAYGRATALQSWLRSPEFSYSLDTPVADGFDGSDAEAIERFLEVREGYCVHFASAFTLMARSVGLPTRIAVGYLPGTATADRVDGRSVYSVTADSLHAWPEVYFAETGWTRFDPTPSIAQAQSVASTGAEEEPEDNEQILPEPENSAPAPTASESATQAATPSATAAAPHGSNGRETGPNWVLPVIVIALALAALPWGVRRALCIARLSAARRGDAFAAWRELIAMVDDARIPRNRALSERSLARELESSGTEFDGAALGALVDAIEFARYSGSAPRRENLAPHLRALSVDIRPAWWGLAPRSLWIR